MAVTTVAGRLDPVTLATAVERLATLVRRLASAGELSLTAASTLSTVGRHGPARVSDLAVREGVTQPAMTQLVIRLEREGYLRRHADSGDARVVLVSLTADGERVLAERRELRARRLAELAGRLGPEHRAAIEAALPALNALADLGHDVERTPAA